MASLIPPMQPTDIIDLEELYVALSLKMSQEAAAKSYVLRIIRMANMMLENAEKEKPIKATMLAALKRARTQFPAIGALPLRTRTEVGDIAREIDAAIAMAEPDDDDEEADTTLYTETGGES